MKDRRHMTVRDKAKHRDGNPPWNEPGLAAMPYMLVIERSGKTHERPHPARKATA